MVGDPLLDKARADMKEALARGKGQDPKPNPISHPGASQPLAPNPQDPDEGSNIIPPPGMPNLSGKKITPPPNLKPAQDPKPNPQDPKPADQTLIESLEAKKNELLELSASLDVKKEELKIQADVILNSGNIPAGKTPPVVDPKIAQKERINNALKGTGLKI